MIHKSGTEQLLDGLAVVLLLAAPFSLHPSLNVLVAAICFGLSLIPHTRRKRLEARLRAARLQETPLCQCHSVQSGVCTEWHVEP